MAINADIYDIDLLDAPSQTIADLQADGKKVICYFSAGTYEDWCDLAVTKGCDGVEPDNMEAYAHSGEHEHSF